METSDKNPAPAAAPESRFTVSPMTLAADRWMGRLIRVGGVGVVLAVFGMLAFLIVQVFPLFIGATVAPISALTVPATAMGFGEDEYGEVPFVVLADGSLVFQRSKDGTKVLDWAPNLGNRRVSSVKSYPRTGLVFLGLSDGTVMEVRVSYRSTFDAAGKRTIEPSVAALEPVAIGKPGLPCVDVWNAKGSLSRLLLVRQEENAKPLLTAVRLTERKGLGGKARIVVSDPFVVAADATSISQILLPSTAESLIVVGKSGEVRAYADDGANFSFLQSFVPFKESRDPAIASAGLIFGNVSVVFVCRDGSQQVWSMYPQLQPDGKSLRRWGKIHDGEILAGPGEGIYAAEGNKCYLAVAGGRLQLRNMTTGTLRWEGEAPAGSIRQVAFSGNYDRFTALSADGKLHRWSIEDHHPESSWGAFFGKIWYEGATGPDYTWQSSSGSDEFEAKYSMMPLIYGTAKGTFFALLFALPIALTAAIYVSQFLRPEYRNVVKPVMEIMASLPSVVLGFLAGLWLAPLVDPRLISIFCAVGILAPAALFAGFLWSALPQPVRRQVKPGMEFVWLLPFLALCAYFAWQAGPAVEAMFFTVKDSVSGLPIADFREWWRQTTGETYDSRNSLVVGFVMGFAVIPIVFTIAEDSLSNVPNSLISGSLALGASRWQTVWSVVVPTAISGIVSAIMIGFGRAIGETMIVVMATGNTAVMEANPFSGMRTLSANIAVELPEAALGHTHYRALFLGACCLFLLTFVINTLAEILRQRLRERYKVV
ncbi:MAG: ABC transporter permease subunit [Opitutales bacterium]|nr:ABC transporter permease subunit [Opitutales bacterium]